VDAALGRLLQALAAGRWRVAAIGAGEAAALIGEAVPPGAVVVTAARGDWYEALMANAPFDLVVLDAATEDAPRVLEIVAPGGVVVAPPDAFWLEHPELYAVELRELGVVVAARQARAFATS
jgi:protein-L-isoaspartate O-methyltransferase